MTTAATARRNIMMEKKCLLCDVERSSKTKRTNTAMGLPLQSYFDERILPFQKDDSAFSDPEVHQQTFEIHVGVPWKTVSRSVRERTDVTATGNSSEADNRGCVLPSTVKRAHRG